MNEKHIPYEDNLRCQIEKQWAVLDIKYLLWFYTCNLLLLGYNCQRYSDGLNLTDQIGNTWNSHILLEIKFHVRCTLGGQTVKGDGKIKVVVSEWSKLWHWMQMKLAADCIQHGLLM